jgi:hypothetical protein
MHSQIFGYQFGNLYNRRMPVIYGEDDGNNGDAQEDRPAGSA